MQNAMRLCLILGVCWLSMSPVTRASMPTPATPPRPAVILATQAGRSQIVADDVASILTGIANGLGGDNAIRDIMGEPEDQYECRMQHFAMLFGLICAIAFLVTAAIHVLLAPARPRRSQS